MKKQSWSIIILAFNEEDSIAFIINQSIEILNQISDDFEIIVIDDGSTDDSGKIIDSIKSDHLIIHKNKKNIGIGPSLRLGYSIASKENVLMIPGDAQFDVNELIPFQEIPENTIVAFYRDTKGVQYNFYRNSLSAINKMVNRFFLGLNMRDVNWVKIYKNNNLKEINIQVYSSLVESEICAKLSSSVKILEFESRYLKRMGGSPKGSSLKIVRKAMKDTVLLICYVNLYKAKRFIDKLRGMNDSH